MSRKYKSTSISNINIEGELIDKIELLSPYITDEETIMRAEIYKAIAYTNEVDRDGEKASDEFLTALVDKIIGVPVIKNHDWKDVDGTLGRVIKAELIEEDGIKKVFILFYATDYYAKEQIESGLYRGISLGFQCDKNKKNELINLTDVYELSFVCVPALQGAHIIKSLEGGIEDMELETLKAENEKLIKELDSANKRIKSLEDVLEQKEADAFEADKTTYLVDEANKAIYEMEPESEEVKEAMLEEFTDAEIKGDLVIEHLSEEDNSEDVVKFASGRMARVKGLDATKEKIKTKYTRLGLLGKKQETVVTKSKDDVDFSTESKSTPQFKSVFSSSTVTIK